VQRIKKVIPKSRIIYVTEKGILGDLRNQGLARATSEYVAFIDDDTLITSEWFIESLKVLKASGNICVCVPPVCTCTLCRTREFKAVGGFPLLDGNIIRKRGIVVADKTYGVVHYTTEWANFVHTLKWFNDGFEYNFPFGTYNGITISFLRIIRFARQKKPLTSLTHVLWLIKALYIKGFKILGIPAERTAKLSIIG
jgi:glycosyltransferase involved in cell wall biosynthesis